MATVTLTSDRSASILQNLDYEETAHLRDASFSSYLNGGEDNSKLKRADSTTQEPTYQVSSGRKNAYGEISVFGAEKYFNGVMDEKETIYAVKKDGGVPVHDMQRKTRGTPSTTSEASWNSRSALLPITQSRQDKPNGKKFFAAMGCNCYCSDKQSVDVDENISEKPSVHSKKNTDSEEIHGKVATKSPTETKHDSVGPAQIKKTPSTSWTKEDIPCGKLDQGGNGVDSQVCFSLPMPNSSVENLSLQSKLEQVEAARRSLEVFGSPPIMDREEIELSIEKRLAMLTWDANPRVEKTTSVPIVESRLNDDIDSDSSSDLFEIKSLSSNGHPFFKRQPSGGMSDCMSPSSIYEPSEASIDWSVVTASAANFSVVSDYEEPVSKDNIKKRDNTKTIAKTAPISTKTETSKDNAKRRPSMLLGCRSQKSVKVMGGAHKLPEKKPEFRGQHKLYSVTPRSRFQPEIKVTDLDSAHAQRAFAMGSQLQSARKLDPVYKL